MSPKRITIDDLAAMVQRGFADIYEKMVTKDDLKDLEARLTGRISSVESRMATKEDLDILESKLMYRFERRFEPLEKDLRNRKRLTD